MTKDYKPVHYFTIISFFTFITYQRTSSFAEGMEFSIPIPFYKSNVMLVISILFFLIYLKRFYYDGITITLFLSAIMSLLSLTYINTENLHIGNFIPLIFSLISYFVCSQAKGDTQDKIYKVIVFIVNIISIQVILTELSFFSTLSTTNLNNVFAKSIMVIPMGASNYIAAVLLPLMTFVYFYDNSVVSKMTLSAGLYALILCRSKNALSVLLLFVFLNLSYKVIRFILKDKKATKITKIVSLCVAFIVFGLVFYQVLNLINNIIVELSFNAYSDLKNPFLKQLDEISSGRISVYLNELNRATEHFLFGNGFVYQIGQNRSHNWIIELLVQKGIVGLALYSVTLTLVFIKLRPYKDDRLIKSVLFTLLVFYIQGLFEVSIFTQTVDFIIFSLIGFAVSRVRILKMGLKSEKIKTV